jgi:hypothetical protein
MPSGNICIIPLRGKVWAHISSFAPPLVIEVPVPRQESEQYCIGVLRGIHFAYVSTFFY